MGMPYGDQAIFLAKDTFFGVGGFLEMPIIEDFELMRRLRRQGRIEIASAPVLTYAHRYNEVGFLKNTLVNQVIILVYLFGISTERLANWYKEVNTSKNPFVSLPGWLRSGPGSKFE